MALTLNEKLWRMLTFLVGMRDPRLFARMATRGMTTDILEEGWNLFTTAAGAKLRYTPSHGGLYGSPEEAKLLAELDDWENSWFPIIAATLSRHHSAVYEKVFENLSQTEGKAVIVSVGTMLDRVAGLAGTPDGDAAAKLLESRGFTAAARKPAEDALAKLREIGEAAMPDVEPTSKEEQEKALEEAWAWYREWSTIARTLFKRGDVLIRLGLRKMRRGSSEPVGEEDDDEPVVPPVEG